MIRYNKALKMIAFINSAASFAFLPANSFHKQVNDLKDKIQEDGNFNILVLCTCGCIFHIPFCKYFAALPLIINDNCTKHQYACGFICDMKSAGHQNML
jgi:hypothetical protein